MGLYIGTKGWGKRVRVFYFFGFVYLIVENVRPSGSPRSRWPWCTAPRRTMDTTLELSHTQAKSTSGDSGAPEVDVSDRDRVELLRKEVVALRAQVAES